MNYWSFSKFYSPQSPLLDGELHLSHLKRCCVCHKLCLFLLLRIRSANVGMVHEGQCLLMQAYFCAVYGYLGKADLSKGHVWQNAIGIKKKIGGNHIDPQFSFWIPIVLIKIWLQLFKGRITLSSG